MKTEESSREQIEMRDSTEEQRIKITRRNQRISNIEHVPAQHRSHEATDSPFARL